MSTDTKFLAGHPSLQQGHPLTDEPITLDDDFLQVLLRLHILDANTPRSLPVVQALATANTITCNLTMDRNVTVGKNRLR